MKKTLLLLAIVALLAVPVTALAATEFSLGGFIKLDSFWDSTQEGKNINSAILRNNSPAFQHGRYFMTAQGSRFNFTIKGPKLWGATVTGFIEVDFDSDTEPGTPFRAGSTPTAVQPLNASHGYTPRMRHAMFRLNWPETELLFGQYWSMFCEYYPELLQDGPLQFHGVPTHRLAQVRVTQKWREFTVSGLVGVPTDINNTGPTDTTSLQWKGANSETPQLQAKIAYEKDLWGKAPFYGVPRGFVAQVVAGWQRSRFNRGTFTAYWFDDDDHRLATFTALQRDNQYLNHWMVQGTLFIPVIPTYSANLAGTASLQAQWYVGAGLEAFGEATSANNSMWTIQNFGESYDRELQKRYGGYVQAQYYFTNQWFTTFVWSMNKAYGVDKSYQVFSAEPFRWWQEYSLALWYRPIQALKFGVQYSYNRTDYFMKAGPTPTKTPADYQNITDKGEAHRIEFVGLFFF